MDHHHLLADASASQPYAMMDEQPTSGDRLHHRLTDRARYARRRVWVAGPL